MTDKIDLLREAFEYTKQRRPFRLDAVAVFPDHLHSIWMLPLGESDYSVRWNNLKGYFSTHVVKGERISAS